MLGTTTRALPPLRAVARADIIGFLRSFSTPPGDAARAASEAVHGRLDPNTVSSAAMRRALRAAAPPPPPRALVEAPAALPPSLNVAPPSLAPAPGFGSVLAANATMGFAMSLAFTGIALLARSFGM
jgi:hypothetical protein